MKIYSKIVIDMHTGAVRSSEWTEYDGPVAECKGGGGAEVDKKYNKGMLKISEKQQGMADEMFNYFKFGVPYNPEQRIKTDEWQAWKDGGKLGEEPEKFSDETVGERRGYDPDAVVSEAELTQEILKSQSELLPMQTEVAKGQLETLGKRSGVMQSLYKEALEGVDVEGRVSEHRAGVTGAFKRSQEQANRALSRSGIDPSSGRGLGLSENLAMGQAKEMAAGETTIRRGAEDENFRRKAVAAGLPV
ncbi:MAG: hypothetical protein V3U84_10820 [Thiotrichaceae bacterium]